MKPPVDPADGQPGRAEGVSPAVALCRPVIETLRHRPEFLRAAQARRQGTAGFLLQARRRQPDESAPCAIRIGFTCSKKLGNAVIRNRAKRRLRALARDVFPALGQPGWDYVLVGRPQVTVSRPFADLLNDLRSALAQVHRTGAP